MEGLLQNILGSIIATLIVGGAVVYQFKFKKNSKNTQSNQNHGKNQIALHNSKKNSVNIKEGGDEDGKRDSSE